MTFVGKILVIAIMAFALLFLGISTVVFTTSKNWMAAGVGFFSCAAADAETASAVTNTKRSGILFMVVSFRDGGR